MVTKILDKRIKRVVLKVIDGSQFVFVEGRNMLDCVVIANKVIHEAKNIKFPVLILKRD